ncbi:MAG: GTPase [Alphaproteobacteria bacterium]|nr:GTPase [Alphaproteobacteria bacterium]
MAARRKIVILGAAGRDFHNFNVLYRDDPSVEVVAFTAGQIPGIAWRRYPPSLSGPLYPGGIPIMEEDQLEYLVKAHRVEAALFAYSDVSHLEVMHLASRALATGADFLLAGPERTMLASSKPVIAVSAVRTGCGKSQVTRYLAQLLKARGRKVAVMRHPMPYGDLDKEAVQRFATREDLMLADCTIEEREEYEPHLADGSVVFAGIDTARVLAAAQAEAEVILWDGGHNDFPFIKPTLHIVLVDALRPDQTNTHHPGEAVLRMAKVIVVAKADATTPEQAEAAAFAAHRLNNKAAIVNGYSPVVLDDPAAVEGKRVLVVEDGPTLTHGGMAYGAGAVAVRRLKGTVLIDPRESAPYNIQAIFEKYPHIGPVLPALGYSALQRSDLRTTIEDSRAEVVVSATPMDLAALLALRKPVVRARYQFAESGAEPSLAAILDEFARRNGL